MTEHSDLTKIRALLRVVGETDGSVSLSGESAVLVADAIAELERLRTARDAAERLADVVEDYAFTTERDASRLRDAWQAYVEAVDKPHAEHVADMARDLADPTGDQQ